MPVAHDTLASSVVAEFVELGQDLGHFQFEGALQELPCAFTDDLVTREHRPVPSPSRGIVCSGRWEEVWHRMTGQNDYAALVRRSCRHHDWLPLRQPRPPRVIYGHPPERSPLALPPSRPPSPRKAFNPTRTGRLVDGSGSGNYIHAESVTLSSVTLVYEYKLAIVGSFVHNSIEVGELDNYWTRNRQVTRRRLLAGTGTAALGVTALLAGCGDDDSTSTPTAGVPSGSPSGTNIPTAAITPTGNLNIAIGGLPPTLDPHRTSGGGYFPYNWEAFEGLLSRDDDARIVPGLANSFEYNGDSTQLTLKLREGVQFHNGDPFTSEDVAFSLERLRTPDFKMAYAPNFDRITSTETPDPSTVTFKSSAPFPELHQLLDSYFYVVPKKYAITAPDFGTAPIGTGPYKVSQFAVDQAITFEAFDGYWGTKARTKTVVLRALPEASTRVSAFQSGEVDLIWGIPPQFIEQIKGNSALSLNQTPAVRVQFIMFNLRGQGNVAYKDPKVREAMNIAINRDQIAKVVFGGGATAGGWFAPRGIVGYKDADPYKYDVKKAKDLLTAAGFGEGLQIDALAYGSGGGLEVMFNGIIADWAKVGIQSTNRPLAADFVDVLRSHTAPLIGTTSQNVTYDGSSDLIRWLRSDGGYSISDGSLDADINKAAASGGAQREVALQSVFQQVYEKFLVIPIVEDGNVFAYSKAAVKAWPQILGWPYPRGYGRIVQA